MASLDIQDLCDLKGTPLPQDSDAGGPPLRPANAIDPRVHFAGRANVSFSEQGGPATLRDLSPYLDDAQQTITSTTRELILDYRNGILTINAPAAQGISGALAKRGTRQD